MNFQDLQQGNKVLLVLSKADSDTADFDNMAKSVGGFVGEHGQVEILDLEKFSGGRCKSICFSSLAWLDQRHTDFGDDCFPVSTLLIFP